ncbi:MAG TPA: aspartate aminotransferase family protein [Chloroflexota bacterium]|nr:aspartate aminotransferase family protein [Chloroflexota bacterium]
MSSEVETTEQIETDYQIPLYKKRDLALVRGEGVYLWDAEGRRYLDMMSNYGVAVLGHSHPAVTDALVEQAKTLLSCHQSFYNDARARFIQVLERLLPDGLRRISFANSGAEAVEAGLKYARAATGRSRIISTKRGYHGRTIGALSVTGEPKHRGLFEPLLAGCEQVVYGDDAALASCIEGAAAFIVEPVQGESGIRPAPPGYLERVRELCDQTGALLILDEVQTAFRTGRAWAWEHSGIQPDIMALSKPLANGLPIGVTVVADRVAGAIPPGSHGTTFGGNPLVCAAAAATLEVLAGPGFNDHVAEMGTLFVERLRAIRNPLIREVRGAGLMIGVELKRNASPVLQRMQMDGVLAIPAGSTAVRFLPPLIVEQEQVTQAAEVLERALQDVAAS